MERASFLRLTAALVVTVPHAAGPPQRIVALMPSLVEDLFALGAGSRVVADSQFADYPPQVKRLPRVASFTSVDAERIVALHPDLIVGNVSQRAVIAPLIRANLRVELFREDSVADIYATLRRLGAILGEDKRAATLIRQMHDESMRLRRTVDRTYTPSVFVVLDVSPIYTVGRRSYINTLIEMAGGKNAANVPQAYARFSPEALLALQPDVIVADPEVGLRSVIRNEPWRSLHAVATGRVAIIPDPGILLHPSPRYNQGLRWLISVLRQSDSPRR